MTIQPFKPGNTDHDPDKAYAKLEVWLDKAIPAFLESPEYKKLSKANQKSEGSWFRLFMDHQLNYIGGDLCHFDEEDAAEILLETFSTKGYLLRLSSENHHSRIDSGLAVSAQRVEQRQEASAGICRRCDWFSERDKKGLSGYLQR